MHLTLLTSGSRGDVQPYLALAKALNAAGHQARLIAPLNFEKLATQHNIEFAPMRANFEELLQGGSLMNSRTNPLKLFKAMQDLIMPLVETMRDDVWNGTEGTEGLISHMAMVGTTQIISEARAIPHLTSALVPLLPSKAHPSPLWFSQKSLGGWYNKATAQLVTSMVWKMLAPIINKGRQDFGLPSQSRREYFALLENVPSLTAISPSVFSRPADYPTNAHVSGYWFLDEPDWQPPASLQEFLAKGEPPVYIGFGSMTGFNAEQTGQLVLEALRLSGARAVLAAGWGGMKLENLPSNVYLLDSAPHSQLFPLMAAAVHHGGAGTTAASLRAGVPTVVIPFIADQNYWGQQVYRLGVGPKPLPRAKLQADKLAEAIHQALTYHEIREKAAQLGAKIRAETGAENAVRLIEHYCAAQKPLLTGTAK